MLLTIISILFLFVLKLLFIFNFETVSFLVFEIEKETRMCAQVVVVLKIKICAIRCGSCTLSFNTNESSFGRKNYLHNIKHSKNSYYCIYCIIQYKKQIKVKYK